MRVPGDLIKCDSDSIAKCKRKHGSDRGEEKLQREEPFVIEVNTGHAFLLIREEQSEPLYNSIVERAIPFELASSKKVLSTPKHPNETEQRPPTGSLRS